MTRSSSVGMSIVNGCLLDSATIVSILTEEMPYSVSSIFFHNPAINQSCLLTFLLFACCLDKLKVLKNPITRQRLIAALEEFK